MLQLNMYKKILVPEECASQILHVELKKKKNY